MSHEKVIEVAPQQARISTVTGTGVASEIDYDSTYNVSFDRGTVYGHSRALLRFPMKVGDSWSTNYTYTPSSGATRWVSHRASVGSTEVVHVAELLAIFSLSG